MKLAILVPIVFAACGSSDGGSAEPAGSATPAKKTANGFSASLSAEMKDGSGAAVAGPNASGAGSSGAGATGDGKAASAAVDPKAGDAKAGDTKVDPGTAKAGDAKADAKAGDTKTGDTKAGDAKAGDAKADAKAGDTKTGDTKAGDAKAGTTTAAVDPKAGDAKTKPGDKTVGNSSPPPPSGTGSGPARPAANRAHVNPPAELAAIKIDLEPNWDRDYDEAGTISFVLKVPNTNDTRLFSFRYGYDLAGAPADREAYKKFLGDQKVLTVTLDRQRGAAWYLEGTDAAGAPAFRVLVLYGGKRLVCGGSLYKDQAATALGPDLRDKVVAAAKKICETLAL